MTSNFAHALLRRLRARFGAFLAAFPGGGFELALILLFLGLLIFQFISLFAPVIGEHGWREAMTFSVARNLHEVSANFFFPRIDWNDGLSGIQAMEAPVFPYVIHLLMYPFGVNEATGRLAAWLFFVAGMVALYRLLARQEDRRAGFSALLFPLLSPLFLLQTRQIQPDWPMLALAIVAAACFTRFAHSELRRYYFLGLLFYALAALTKSPIIFAGPALWAFSISARPVGFKRAALRLSGFLIPAGIFAGWYFWAHHLSDVYNQGQTYFVFKLSWQGALANMKNALVLNHIFLNLMPNQAVGATVLPLIAAGMALSLKPGRRRKALPWWLWFAGAVPFCFLFSENFWSHGYLMTLFAVPLAYFGALALAWLLALRHRWKKAAPRERWAAFLILGLCALSPLVREQWFALAGLAALCGVSFLANGSLHLSFLRNPLTYKLALAIGLVAAMGYGGYQVTQGFVKRASYSRWRNYERDWGALKRAVAAHSSRRDLFIAAMPNPWGLHLIERRGWRKVPMKLRMEGLKSYYKRGARFLVRFDPANRSLERMLGLGRPLASGHNFALYAIPSEPRPVKTIRHTGWKMSKGPLPKEWQKVAFDDAKWKAVTLPSNFWRCDKCKRYFRLPLTLPRKFGVAWAQFASDDGIRLYINGKQILSAGGLNGDSGVAGGHHNDAIYDQPRNLTRHFRPGKNVIAAEVHEATGSELFDFIIFFDKQQKPKPR